MKKITVSGLIVLVAVMVLGNPLMPSRSSDPARMALG
jgi:hypothetical protein